MTQPDACHERPTSASLRAELERLLREFGDRRPEEDLRERVRALVPAYSALRKLGKSLLPVASSSPARDRILYYFRQYPSIPIAGAELLVVSGIQEYARRVRELRVQQGWSILSGLAVREMARDEDGEPVPEGWRAMKPDDYVLSEVAQDREAAHRWHLAHSIRNHPGSAQDRMLELLRASVGNKVSGEELRYVARERTEWARRVRELRTQEGWPIVTRTTGDPTLSVGTYVLKADQQLPAHDRKIDERVRAEVLRRDGFCCQDCKWSQSAWHVADPRHLELHHVVQHVDGGSNDAQNLRTLCNRCHDCIHKSQPGT